MPNVNSVLFPRYRRVCLPIWVSLTAMLTSVGMGASPLEEARELYAERRYAEAEQAFAELENQYPNSPEVLLYAGKLAVKRREWVTAIDFLERAQQLQPDDAEISFQLGTTAGLYAGSLGKSLSALAQARRASKAMLRAIDLNPDNLSYRQALIEFSLNAPALAGGGHKRAHDQADAIAQIDAAQGAFAHAGIHRAAGDHTAALLALDDLIAVAPNNYFALFRFGRCAAESGERLSEGLTRLEKCLTLPAPERAASHAEVWWNIATIQKHRNDRAAALSALEQAVAMAPQHQQIAADLAGYRADNS
ncbi:tetratricopeptide repeat protein [Opitutaceae bacterium]|nr:tetratricopeptide repeat protein [Opitutaceae bacterium]